MKITIKTGVLNLHLGTVATDDLVFEVGTVNLVQAETEEIHPDAEIINSRIDELLAKFGVGISVQPEVAPEDVELPVPAAQAAAAWALDDGCPKCGYSYSSCRCPAPVKQDFRPQATSDVDPFASCLKCGLYLDNKELSCKCGSGDDTPPAAPVVPVVAPFFKRRVVPITKTEIAEACEHCGSRIVHSMAHGAPTKYCSNKDCRIAHRKKNKNEGVPAVKATKVDISKSVLPWSDPKFKAAVVGALSHKPFRDRNGFVIIKTVTGMRKHVISYLARIESTLESSDEIVAYGSLDNGKWFLIENQGNDVFEVSAEAWLC